MWCVVLISARPCQPSEVSLRPWVNHRPSSGMGRQPREQSRLQVAEVEHPRGGWGETAAVATGGCQGSPQLQMLLQMLRKFLHLNSHHVEQPSKKATNWAARRTRLRC